tara:strand:- start:10282 stop:10773 length:492 start_codon:yes stop_codon:yes gene_type:complete
MSDNQTWETDIRLIQSDIKQINKFFNKVEKSIDQMAELSKNVAVQSEVLDNTKNKLEDVERLIDDSNRTDGLKLTAMSDRLEEYRRSAREDHQRLADHNADKRNATHKEILDRIDAMEKSVHSRVNDQNKKVNALENWRYYMMGMGGVLLLLVARINWPDLFG